MLRNRHPFDKLNILFLRSTSDREDVRCRTSSGLQSVTRKLCEGAYLSRQRQVQFFSSLPITDYSLLCVWQGIVISRGQDKWLTPTALIMMTMTMMRRTTIMVMMMSNNNDDGDVVFFSNRWKRPWLKLK